jgi:hypothetical protein
MYPAAHKDRIFLYEGRLQIAVDCEESKMPSNDPLGCVVWAIEHKVEYDGPPCVNIISLPHASISSFRDYFTVSGAKVQRVKYKFAGTPFVQYLREPDSASVLEGKIALYQKAMMTPLPPGFNDDVKRALVVHRDELFRGGLQTSDRQSPTVTERKSEAKAKKRTPKKKRRLVWLSNAATYRQFQSAQVRRRRT